MTLVSSPSAINEQINALKRLHYKSVTPEERERRAEKRRAYTQSRRDYFLKHRSFVCHTCLDKTGEALCFSGKQELNRHLQGPRHLRQALPLVADTECLRMLTSEASDPTVETTSMLDEGCTNGET